MVVYLRDLPEHFFCAAILRSCRSVYLTQSQYTDTEPTSPSADPLTPGAWQGSHTITNYVTGMTQPQKTPTPKAGIKPRSATLHADA